MYIVVDERDEVTAAYEAALRNEGIASLGFVPAEFSDWLPSVSPGDIGAVQSFLLGEFAGRTTYPEIIRNRTRAPIIALEEVRSLDTTLELFQAGHDDVVRKPVHVREIMARVNAIWRRSNSHLEKHLGTQRLRVFFDGRDVEIDGEPLPLPRRERRILEFLAKNAHRRVTKTQIFDAVYGLFEDNVDEIVVEGHISKLRKKLRMRIGHDVIDARRYLGYQFVGEEQRQPTKEATVRDREAAMAA